MYLKTLRIQGFRRFNDLSLNFKDGLNVIVGPNNAGKTAVVDALRVLLAASDEGNLRLTELDLHENPEGATSPTATFIFVFSGLSEQNEADFSNALIPVKGADGKKILRYDAQFSVQYTQAEPGGRLRLRRWVGTHEENAMSTEMLEELRAIYLQPLRDPEQGLRPGRMSQLSKLIQNMMPDKAAREALVHKLKEIDEKLAENEPISTTTSAISTKHNAMLGSVLAQALKLDLTPSDFNRFAARVGMLVGGRDVEQNGLGFNNLIYMAVVLSELAFNKTASYCGLLVEEPEAHLHGSRAMGCARAPYLVHGGEQFLAGYRFGADPKNRLGIDELALDLEDGKTAVHRRFKNGGSKRLDQATAKLAIAQIAKLGKNGGYTYAAGRAWARLLLKIEPRITVALARRFPHILVDEAQDIGRYEGALLDMLSAEGCTISLVGDFHQSIYGFNFATGEYLKNFAGRADVLELPLTQNRRSLECIVNAANSLAGTASKPFRTPPARPTGAYFWTYDAKALPQFMSAWVTALNATGYSVGDAVVLCRGSGLLAKLSTESNQVGQSAVKHFATAAIEREQAADISKVLEHCAKGVMAIVAGLPESFLADLESLRGDAHMQTLRRLLWPLIRNPATGIPLATLTARTGWLKQLKQNLNAWLTLVEQKTHLKREPTWTNRVTATELPKVGPLIAVDIGQNDWSALRCGTVHSAKGEGIPAVMYLADKDDLKALVSGTGGEEGRIGFVAATRARDLLVVAIPKGGPVDIVEQLKAHGFKESDPGKLAAAAVVPVA